MNFDKIAYIALGSNIGEPKMQILQAYEAINAIEEIDIIAKSSLYQTKPIGPSQPDIINSVIKVKTRLSALELLFKLQEIEALNHRKRTIRFGPRTLDLDILTYENEKNDSEILTIPHPRMHQRNFVLIPLAEIEPDFILDGFGKVSDLIAQNNPEDYVYKVE